jgi:predicted amidohydrolase YtcJ
LRGIKIFADGSIGARAAALFAAYKDRPDECGQLFHTDAELRRRVHAGHAAGWTIAIHAIGDRAIAQVVDAFAELPPDEIRAHRHRIEHFELPRDREIDRIAELGVRPCVQPNFVGLWGGSGQLYETALGAERAGRMNPFAELVRRGTGVFFGSDGMPASPLFGIRSAERHPVPGQQIDRGLACLLYTEAAAEGVTGTADPARLREGAAADLVAWSPEPEQRNDVDLTILGGRVVHDRLSLEDSASGC